MNYLITNSSGVVVNAIVAQFTEEERIAYEKETGFECVLHTGQAWIGWVKNADGSFHDPTQVDAKEPV